MTVPLWVSIMVAMIAGVFAAIISPLVTASLSRRSWQRQRRLELKYKIFRGAIRALAMWLTDALDTELQGSKTEYEGSARAVEMRPEASQTLEEYRRIVSALFCKEVSCSFDEAIRAPISIETVPNTDFEQKRRRFEEAASRDLGIFRS